MSNNTAKNQHKNKEISLEAISTAFDILPTKLKTVRFDDIQNEIENYQKANEIYEKSRKDLLEQVQESSLLVPISLWVESQKNSIDRLEGYAVFTHLVKSGLLKIENHSGNIISVKEASHWDHDAVIDAIRSHSDWLPVYKEEYVDAYIDLTKFLCKFTHGLIREAVDRDRNLVKRKVLSFDAFISLIDLLKLRDRVIAKILYFGDRVNLDEVLSLEIQQIDFDRQVINFDSGYRYYPKHVIQDLKMLMDNRSSGLVLLSKQGKKLDSTVPYRAVKSAAAQLNFDNSFSLKSLIDTV